jgi:hypothetical protein
MLAGNRMTLEDALRKIKLLSRVTSHNGAFQTEAENAANLAARLMERFAIKTEAVPSTAPSQTHRLTWVYWIRLLAEFGIDLRYFGKRGSASLADGRLIHIRLDTGQWQVRRGMQPDSEAAARDWGLETLRAYLFACGPRPFTFARA